jgi:hypothetical protein
MAFKYKLSENKQTGDLHAGTKDWDKELLKKWDKEWDDKKAETSQSSPDIQERIKNIAKKALSEKKCGDCKPIRK